MTEPGPSSSTGGPKTEYPGKLISAASIASPFQTDVANTITKRTAQGKKAPKLVGILATPSPPSVAYAEWTKKACEQVGIDFEIWKTWQDEEPDAQQASTTVKMEGVEEDERLNTDLEADVEDLIIAANADDSIHGIMIYYPIFGGRQDTYLQQILDPRKDVEGLHFSYCWNMYHNVRWVLPRQIGGAPGTTTEVAAGPVEREGDIPAGFAKSILPCTPLAVVKCLEAMGVYDSSLTYGDRLYGKVITVVNRSEVVGRPLAALLSNDGAKVFSIDLDSIQEFNKRVSVEKDRQPSAAVKAAREKNSQRRLQSHHTVRPCNLTMEQAIRASDVVISGVPSEKFKIETDWIKEGAVTVNFSSAKNFEKDVRRRASKHLPAIGKTTIAMLQRNLLRLVEYREMSSSSSSGGSDPINSAGQNGGSSGGSDAFGDGSSGQEGQPRPSTGPTSGNHGNGASNNQSMRGGGGGGAHDSQIGSDQEPQRRSALEHSPLVRMNHLSNHFNPRGRSATMTLPPPGGERRDRLPNMSQFSPSNRYLQTRRGSVSTATNVWDWRPQVRRDSIASTAGSPLLDAVRGNRAGSISQQSPLLFAPISPYPSHQGTASSHLTARPSSSRRNSHNGADSPRSTTPVSPLFIDGLSVEDPSTAPTGPPNVRNSWDYTAPLTPREGQVIPSVFERPTRDIPQRHPRGYFSPKDDKMAPSATLHPMVAAAQEPRHVTMIEAAPDRLAHSRRRRRQRFSYSSLIAQAISSSPEGRMTLREIYTWISNYCPEMYPMEDKKGEGWQNTVRHNLSLNKAFVKVARTAQDIYESCASGEPSMSQAARGKGGWWTLDHSVASQAQLKGEAELSEFGIEYNEELDNDNDDQRAQRRRRTDSNAVSVMSGEDLVTDRYTVPSVLQQPSPRRQPSDRTVAHGAVPSVFMLPRPQSAERSMTLIGAKRPTIEQIKSAGTGRARGYTMGDAEASYRRHNAALSNSPGKRKMPFATHASDYQSSRVSMVEQSPSAHQQQLQSHVRSSPLSSYSHTIALPPLQQHHHPSPIQRGVTPSPPSRLSLLRRVDGQPAPPMNPATKAAVARMAINDLLNS